MRFEFTNNMPTLWVDSPEGPEEQLKLEFYVPYDDNDYTAGECEGVYWQGVDNEEPDTWKYIWFKVGEKFHTLETLAGEAEEYMANFLADCRAEDSVMQRHIDCEKKVML